MGTEEGGVVHPYEASPRDLVAVEVVFPQGVREDGRVYARGGKLVLMRGHAMAQNHPGRPVYRILSTVHYANGPEDQAEQHPEEGPLVIG